MTKYFRLLIADCSFADYFHFVAGKADQIRGPLFNRQLKIGNRKCLHSSFVNVTFKVDLSSLTSSTLPVKLWNGPDLMRTVSPAEYENFGFGFSAANSC